jgi:hypothetical protein
MGVGMYWMFADGLNGDSFSNYEESYEGSSCSGREPNSSYYRGDPLYFHCVLPEWATLEDYSEKSYKVIIDNNHCRGSFFFAKSLVREMFGAKMVHKKIFYKNLRSLYDQHNV